MTLRDTIRPKETGNEGNRQRSPKETGNEGNRQRSSQAESNPYRLRPVTSWPKPEEVLPAREELPCVFGTPRETGNEGERQSPQAGSSTFGMKPITSRPKPEGPLYTAAHQLAAGIGTPNVF